MASSRVASSRRTAWSSRTRKVVPVGRQDVEADDADLDVAGSRHEQDGVELLVHDLRGHVACAQDGLGEEEEEPLRPVAQDLLAVDSAGNDAFDVAETGDLLSAAHRAGVVGGLEQIRDDVGIPLADRRGGALHGAVALLVLAHAGTAESTPERDLHALLSQLVEDHLPNILGGAESVEVPSDEVEGGNARGEFKTRDAALVDPQAGGHVRLTDPGSLAECSEIETDSTALRGRSRPGHLSRGGGGAGPPAHVTTRSSARRAG
jgi:hypothetical protein